MKTGVKVAGYAVTVAAVFGIAVGLGAVGGSGVDGGGPEHGHDD
ncbi:MAG TPA: hypothetical protein VK059_00635 [Nocardioidaceae bacterium]|nr:hypothetical protein [Nocardioidaceae bacterium]